MSAFPKERRRVQAGSDGRDVGAGPAAPAAAEAGGPSRPAGALGEPDLTELQLDSTTVKAHPTAAWAAAAAD